VSTPTARSLVLDLLSTLRRGSMPVRALVDAAALFGIAEGSVRVALTRLLAQGRIERDERGAYRLGEASAAVQARLASWRELATRLRPWSGGWIAALDRGVRPSRAAQRRSERALRLTGFRRLERGVALRPDNLAGGVERAREELARLGLAPGVLVCRLDELDRVSEARARALWDAPQLLAEWRRHVRALEVSGRRLGALSEEQAMVESFTLGGEALRQLALDPLLPEPLTPARERQALVDAMRRYDELGRACWRGFLSRYGVLPRAAARDTRAIAEGGVR
jgi:phenylacetic acid degradation operon negative regulatory protein